MNILPNEAMTAVTPTFETGVRHEGDNDEISIVTDELIRERSFLLEPFLERYVDWIEETGVETPRSKNAYTRDLLTLGVLWRCYGSRAVDVPPPFAWLMTGLLRLRRRKPAWRASIDQVRSRLAPLLLGPRFGDVASPGIPSGCSMIALLRWMDATGDYRAEVARLRPLCAFLKSRERFEREWYLAQLSAYAARFGQLASHRLRGEDSAAQRSDSRGSHREKESALHVTRKHIEYHLRVVGEELRQREGREDDVSVFTRSV